MLQMIRVAWLSWKLRHAERSNERRRIAKELSDTRYSLAVRPLFEAICNPVWQGSEEHGGFESREPFIDALKSMGTVAADKLAVWTTDPDPRIRFHAAGLLADLDDPRAIEPLLLMLEDGGPGHSVVKSLERITGFQPTVEQQAIMAVASDDFDRAVSIGAAAVEPLINRILSRNSVDIKKQCIRALGKLADRRAVPVLSAELNKELKFPTKGYLSFDSFLTEDYANALAAIGGADAVEALREAQRLTERGDCHEHFSAAVTQAIARISDGAAEMNR